MAGAGRLHPAEGIAGCCRRRRRHPVGVGWRRPPLLLLALLSLPRAGAAAQGENLHACKESEYHYEYTECDSVGSRWRVAVPHTPGLCTGLPDPIKGTKCSFSCKAGEFLNMKNQSCKPCAEGTYSLGTGVRFDEWDELPHGFASTATNFEIDYNLLESLGNCTKSTWVPKGDYIASNTDECIATLMYAVNLKQSGTVSFDYIYPDSNIVFEFFVQNDQCQPTVEDSRWMKTTERGWEKHSVELSRGNNVLFWKTTALSVWSKSPKPVLVKNIGITGVAYTSECFPCKAGTYTAKSGSSFCQQCPANSFSSKGATSCQQCEPANYSEPGSSSCKPRPACTDKDYFYTHTACDTNGETQLMYKWAEPKICNEDIPKAVKLPPSGVKMMCPPCNPGFFKTNTSTCKPCPYGTYSNGTGCTNCPVGTEPAVGFEYKWWNTLPANMETTVLSGISFEYKRMAGWEVAGDYIYTAAGASDNDFMILTLVIPGFSPPQSVMEDSENKKIAEITFVFETICSVNCELYFMVGMNSRTNSPVETWIGSKGKQSYTYIVEKNATTSFTWAFQRTAYDEAGRKYTNDVARLYSINVTNVIDGVASYCRQCALETSGSSCTSCPHGHYIDKTSGGCSPCPLNTYLKAHQPYGKQACIPCGPGTKNNKIHSLCYNDCHFSISMKDRTLEYDFSRLANSTSFLGGPSFTSKGLEYFHHFNISLCGNYGKKTALCIDNVTDIHILGKDTEFSKSTSSYVCQSVMIPSEVRGYKTTVSSQPVNLADTFVGVTIKHTLDNITSHADYFPAENEHLPDVIFFYRSKDVTQTCHDGRVTTIRLRCDPLKFESGTLSLPSKCPDGTCDGCTFHFLWESVEACPRCSAEDYHAIISGCIGGIQRTTYVWRKPKLCAGGVLLPEEKVSICKSMDFWLKVGISAGTCTAILLTVMTCYFWKKNQKLEYKYSKLVMNASAKDGELPAADSCAIMEGEDAEDDLLFTSKNSLFGKIKAFTSKASLKFSQAWQDSVCRAVLNKLRGRIFQEIVYLKTSNNAIFSNLRSRSVELQPSELPRTSDGFDSVPLKTSSGTTDMDL